MDIVGWAVIACSNETFAHPNTPGLRRGIEEGEGRSNSKLSREEGGEKNARFLMTSQFCFYLQRSRRRAQSCCSSS